MSFVILIVLKEYDIIFDFVVGYSLGEYSVFVVVGVLIFEDVVYVVRKCGEYMEEVVLGGEGVMVVILGVDLYMLK